MCMYANIKMCVRMYECMYINIINTVKISMYACTYVCMYVCHKLYVYEIYTHTHIVGVDCVCVCVNTYMKINIYKYVRIAICFSWILNSSFNTFFGLTAFLLKHHAYYSKWYNALLSIMAFIFTIFQQLCIQDDDQKNV